MSDDNTQAPVTGNQPISAPVPPPPATEFKPDNIEQIIKNQFTQAYNYHKQVLDIKTEYDKFKADADAALKANTDKINAFDTLSQRTEQLNSFAANILKVKFESLDKEFLEAYGEELKIEDLIKDPLAGIETIDKNLKVFNAMVQKFKSQQDDGTKGKPANVQAEVIKMETQSDWLRAAREHAKSKAGL